MSQENGELDICVHVPKNAGITWRGLLIAKFGSENVFSNDVRSGRISSMKAQGFKADNSQWRGFKWLPEVVPPPLAQTTLAVRDRIIGHSPQHALQHARAVIGHFAVDTFDNVPEAQNANYFTIVRQPLDRMLSHYLYLLQLQRLMPRMRHWGETHNVNQDFGSFALDPTLKNYQAQFIGNDMSRYAAVGVFDNLGNFFARAGLIVDSQAPFPWLNQTTKQARSQDEAIIRDRGFVREFSEFHALDYELYETAKSG